MINFKSITVLLSLFLLFQVHNIHVLKIQLFKNSETLCADIDIQEVFDSKAHTTLTSGLPLRLILLAKIKDENKDEIANKQTEILIQYDVWDEIFSVTYPDRIERFRTMDSLKSDLNTIRNIPLASIQQLRADLSYDALLKIYLQNDSPESLIDSMDHAPNNSFSLITIIKFFFGRPEPRDHWYHSGAFKLSALKNR